MLLLFGINCCLLLVPSLGYGFYQEQIPNGNRVPHPCKANYLWPGVGHYNPKGGGRRNTFGADFIAADHMWTEELCRLDSDGDGKTNGEELGDPNCVWSYGQSPSRIVDITHPDVCDPFNSTMCRGKNDFVTCALDEFESCDIRKPGIVTVDLRVDITEFPFLEFECLTFELPNDQDYHILANEPIIDNKDVLHHITLFVCEEYIDLKYDEPRSCGMIFDGCNIVIAFWTVGMSGQCFWPKAGYRIGSSTHRWAILQVNYKIPLILRTFIDSSGLRLYIQPALPEVPDMATLMTGQTLLSIPSGEQMVTKVGVCPSDCTQKMLNEPFYVMAAFNHIQYFGSSIKVELFRGGVKLIDITNEDHYSYDSRHVFTHDPAIEVRPGDEIRTTCVYNSMHEYDLVDFESQLWNDVCFGYLFTYPRNALKFDSEGCVSYGRLSRCDVLYKTPVDGCDWVQFVSNLTSVASKVVCSCTEICSPECVKKVQPLIDHSCLKGEISEVISDKVGEMYGVNLVLDMLYRRYQNGPCSVDTVPDESMKLKFLCPKLVPDEGTKTTLQSTELVPDEGTKSTLGSTELVPDEGTKSTLEFTELVPDEGTKSTLGFTELVPDEGTKSTLGFTELVPDEGTKSTLGSTELVPDEGTKSTLGSTELVPDEGTKSTLGSTELVPDEAPKSTLASIALVFATIVYIALA